MSMFNEPGFIKRIKQAGGLSAVIWGTITGTLSDQTDLQAALDAKTTALKILYNNEDLIIPDNIQITGHDEIYLSGTAELDLQGSASLMLI